MRTTKAIIFLLGCSFGALVLTTPLTAGAALGLKAKGHNMETKVDRHLPGFSIDEVTALTESQQILVGTLLSIGNPDPGAPGQTYYSNASVRVVRWLKGKPSESHAADPLKVSYTVQKMPAIVAEESLIKDANYIFFLVANDKQTSRAIKIMPADDESVRRVEHLLHH